jgi:hypothetical protein
LMRRLRLYAVVGEHLLQPHALSYHAYVDCEVGVEALFDMKVKFNYLITIFKNELDDFFNIRPTLETN